MEERSTRKGWKVKLNSHEWPNHSTENIEPTTEVVNANKG
jgi:hypothetical protein